MDLNLANKTGIVTGGSAGIGLACAKALFKEGINIVIAAHEGVDEAVENITEIGVVMQDNTAVPMKVDLSKSDQAKKVVEKAIDRFGGIDILINCAGAAKAGSFLDLTDNDFLDAWTLKLLGYIRMIREVVPHMIKQRDGCIINIVGAAGRTPPTTFLAGSTANAALINFTRGVSKELAPHNIRINAISPAATATERAKRLAEQTARAKNISLEEVLGETTKSIPIGRMISPSEIAALALFLISDHASSITGAEILIDGGQTPGI